MVKDNVQASQDDRELLDRALARMVGNGPLKCCFVGCEARGIPRKGFTFYACDPCLDGLEAELAHQYLFESPAATNGRLQ